MQMTSLLVSFSFRHVEYELFRLVIQSSNQHERLLKATRPSRLKQTVKLTVLLFVDSIKNKQKGQTLVANEPRTAYEAHDTIITIPSEGPCYAMIMETIMWNWAFWVREAARNWNIWPTRDREKEDQHKAWLHIYWWPANTGRVSPIAHKFLWNDLRR